MYISKNGKGGGQAVGQLCNQVCIGSAQFEESESDRDGGRRGKSHSSGVEQGTITEKGTLICLAEFWSWLKVNVKIHL